MARKLKSDRVLFLATLTLIVLSVLMVYSASAAIAFERYGTEWTFVEKQTMWALIGIPTMLLVMEVDYRTYREPVVIWTFLIVVMVALVLVLFSPPINNARRWFSVFSLGIQPSELAKLSAILFIAALLERRMHRINELSYALLPIGLIVGVIIGLILLEPDFGTAVSLGLIAAVMIFAAGLNYAYIVGAILLALPAATVLMMHASYRRRRLFAFLNPWEDPLDKGFQIIQSLIAVGTGGMSGKGFMNGVQKLFYLPEPHTDFIYAVIAEEFGLVGATLILICFMVIAWRGVRIALRAPDSFGSYLALGLTTMVTVQAFVNMSVVLGLMPTKGIPLPFVSAGGSSLLINLLGMGVLLNVSQHASSEA